MGREEERRIVKEAIDRHLRENLQKYVGTFDREGLRREVVELLADIAASGEPWHDNLAQVLMAGWFGMPDDFDAKALLRGVPTDVLERAAGYFDRIEEGPAGWIQVELLVRQGHLEDWSFRKEGDRAIVEVKTKNPLDYVAVTVEIEPKKP